MPKINVNGVTREMTPEEIAEMERQFAEMPELEQTPEERLDCVEYLAAMAYVNSEYAAALTELEG